MKKIYINPTVNVLEIKTTQMIAASGDVDLHSGPASEWGSRRNRRDWDDDDDFDEDF